MIRKIIDRWNGSASKQLAFLIFVSGTAFSFYRPELASNVLVESWMYSALLIGGKTISTAYENKANKESRE